MKFSPKKGFTALELIITMTVFAIIIALVITIFFSIARTKGSLEARQTLTRDSYFFLEKLQTMIKNYSIDYEEYRNRRFAGCGAPGNASRSGQVNCANVFTTYGNHNSRYAGNPTQNKLFYCSSASPFGPDLGTEDYKVFRVGIDPLTNLSGYIDDCLIAGAITNSISTPFIQSYGQYKALFTDVKDDVDFIVGAAHDDDDFDIGRLNYNAVFTEDGSKPIELYLISRDGKQRLYFRRSLVDVSTNPSDRLYTIQVLQLRGLDAGANHDFDADNYSGVYDGIVDTRACDYGRGFICHGTNIGGVYSGYHLPSDANDGWRDLTSHDITVLDRWTEVNPLSDPYLSRNDEASQTNPFVRLGFLSRLYSRNWKGKITPEEIEKYTIALQTAFSFFYFNN